MYNEKTISNLVWALNESQREEFSELLTKWKSEKLDKKLNSGYNNKFTCDEIITDLESATNYERRQKAKEEAKKKGETTIPKDRWGTHETHCCIKHGCKYGDSDCPVTIALVKQRYDCETCSDDEIERGWYKKQPDEYTDDVGEEEVKELLTTWEEIYQRKIRDKNLKELGV